MHNQTRDRHLHELRRRQLVPTQVESVLLVGSVARGWSNADSDVDLYVICGDPATVPHTARWRGVPLQPDAVYQEITYIDGQRYDLEYWLDTQVEQMLDKVDWATSELGEQSDGRLHPREIEFLERLAHAVPLAGPDWLTKRRRQLDNSALSSIATARSLHHAYLLVEDAAGQLRAGDIESAVLSTKLAFGRTIDGLLAVHGEYGQHAKWRARRFRAINQDLVSFDAYWAIETLKDFDPRQPTRWVESVIRLCRHILSKTSV
jgi:Nucleotidyltransferase domain